MANKIDLKKDRVITQLQGEEFAAKNKMKYVEMSCKKMDEKFMRKVLYDLGIVIMELCDNDMLYY